MKTTALTLEFQGPLATITLTQPEVRNAFSDEVIADITQAFHSVGKRSDVRAWCWPPRARPFAQAPTSTGCAAWPTTRATRTARTPACWPKCCA